jgi:hypothetical protein
LNRHPGRTVYFSLGGALLRPLEGPRSARSNPAKAGASFIRSCVARAKPDFYGAAVTRLKQNCAAYPRGVAVVDATVTDAELKRLNGVGFNLVQAGATTAEMIEPLSRRVNDLGWHIQIQGSSPGGLVIGRSAHMRR